MEDTRDLAPPPAPSRQAGRAALLVALAALVALWGAFFMLRPLRIWEATGDYALLGLAHAFNVEYRIGHGGFSSGQGPVSQFQYTHPGIPYQFASWLAYRISLPTTRGEGARMWLVLQSPRRFLLCCRVLVLLLSALALWCLSAELRGVGFWGALLVYASILAYPPIWDFTLVTLGNESFALLGAVLFFRQARAVLEQDRPTFLRSLLLGVTAGAIYLIKLNYVAFPFALLLVFAGAALLRLIPLREVARRTAGSLAGFGLALACAVVWLTPAGFKEMARCHWAVLTHSGYYGGGDRGVLASDVLSASLARLQQDASSSRLVLLLTATCVALLVLALRERGSRARVLPGLLLLIAAAGLMLATFKHWAPHYLIPAAAVLPLGLAWLLHALQGREGFRGALAALVLAAVVSGGTRAWEIHASERASQALWRQEIAEVESVPLGEGEVRLWSYAISTRQQTLPQMLSFSGRPDAERIGEAVLPRDRLYNIWGKKVADAAGWKSVGEVKWRTAAFCRGYFPDRSKVPAEFLVPGCEVKTTPRMLVVIHPPRSGGNRSVPAQQRAVAP
jgi:hypothetical protein